MYKGKTTASQKCAAKFPEHAYNFKYNLEWIDFYKLHCDGTERGYACVGTIQNLPK